MPAPRITPAPDFGRFRDTLLLKHSYKRVPLFDFHVAPEHLAAVIDRPVTTARDRVEAFRRLGYDYVHTPLYAPMDELHAAQRANREGSGSRSHGGNLRIVQSLEQFRSRRWSWQPVADGDFSAVRGQFDHLQQAAGVLPAGMKLLLHTADVFTFAWELIGFDELCLASYEDPDLVSAVMESIFQAQYRMLSEGLRVAGTAAGAVLYSDDIAYTEGLMLGPDFYRRELFGRMKQLIDLAGRYDAPTIYHSDGRLYPVFDDLAAVGVKGIQPLEPKSMDPVEIQRRWPGQFCLMGNIDLDLMSRGTADAVERHVRDRIDRLNAAGGYMAGVSNTVPYYVKFENYCRMIETVYSYPDETV